MKNSPMPDEINYQIENLDNNEGENIMVNINKATQTELETIPGIGPSTALKILD